MNTANLRLRTSIPARQLTPRLLLLTALLLSLPRLSAQLATSPAAPAKPIEPEPVLVLSPFVVEADADAGYVSSSTLAGSRLKTDFKNIASQITVMTPDYLADIGAVSAEGAFPYSLNVENLAENVGSGDYGTMNNDGKANTRSRGLSAATTSRNFFNSQIKQDTYNTGDLGITFASGPNAILFGLGSPAGIIDVRLNRAQAVKKGGLRLRYDAHGTQRAAVDYNLPILSGKTFVAARIDALYDNSKYAFAPSYDRQKRIFGTVGLGLFHNRVHFDVSGEYLDEKSSRPAYTVAKDAASVWFDPAVPGNHTGWKPGDAFAGKTVFNRQGGPTPSYVYGAGVTAPGMYNYDGLVQVMTLGNWLGNNGLLPSTFDTFRGNTLYDDALYPIYKYALYGDTHLALTRAKNVTALGQIKVIDDLYLEVGAMYESFEGKSSDMFLGGQMSLNLDPNLYSPTVSSAAGGLANVPNPNYGKFFLDGQGRGQLISDWDKEVRASLAYEFDAGRRLSGLGRFAKMLGMQRFVGLISAKEQQRISQSFNRLTMDNADGSTPAIITATSAIKPAVDNGVTNYFYLNQNNRRFHFREYIDVNDPIYKWGSWGGLDPFGTWTLKDYNGKDFQVALFDGVGAPSSPNSRRNMLISKGLTYQGMFFRDRLALTYGKRWESLDAKELDIGWRTQDRITGLVKNYQDGAPWGQYAARPSMTNDSRGAVVHVFPWLSLHYSRSTNNDTVSQSHDITGAPTDATTGVGKDYGVRVAFGGLTLRYNRFDNQSKNEDAGSVFNNLRDNISNLEMRLQATNPNEWQPYGKSASAEGFYPQLHQSIGRDYYRMTADSVSTGQELEVAGRIKNLDVRVTVAKTRSVKSNISQSWLQYVIDRQPLFENMKWYDVISGLPVVRVDNVGGTLVPVLGNPGDAPVTGWQNVLFKDNASQTIYDYYLNTVLANTYYRTIQQDGRTNDAIRQWRINASMAYRINKNWRTGFSTRYRDKAVIGYGTRTDNVPLLGVPTSITVIDLNTRFYTAAQWFFDPFISYKGTYKKLPYTVQLNVSNVFDKSEIYPILAYSKPLDTTNPLLANWKSGATASYVLQEPRNVVLSLSVGF